MLLLAARSFGRTSTIALLVLSCLDGGPTQPPKPLPAGGHHVLFIGNSLTYVNDLPTTVAALAASADDTVRVETIANADFALIDHLNGGSAALAAVRQGGWEYVVLQQGPSSLAVNRDSLRLWTQMFDPYIRAVGATPALFMVWQPANRRDAFDDVRAAYQDAATAVHGVFLPAGEAWLNAWAADPSLPLYGSDGYHPSPMGTYLSALEIVECITKRDARTLPARAVGSLAVIGSDTATIRVLQRAAHEANARFHGC